MCQIRAALGVKGRFFIFDVTRKIPEIAQRFLVREDLRSIGFSCREDQQFWEGVQGL